MKKQSIFFMGTILVFDDEFIEMNNLTDYYTFILSDHYKTFRDRSLKLLKRKRNFEILDLTELYKECGIQNSKDIKISGILLSFEKMLFSNLINDAEAIIGTKLLKTFNDFYEVRKFQSIFKNIIDFFYDRNLMNFTIQQYEETVKIRENFKKDVIEFRRYLKYLD